MPLCHASVDLALITDDDAKKTQNATYFAYDEFPSTYISRKLFSRATFASQIVGLYLAPFRSYVASKLRLGLLENSTYLAFCPQTIHFYLRKRRRYMRLHAMFVCLSVCLLARLLKTRVWIWMKFCVSTGVGTWRN